jgi:PPOX class probable F420-dependent enzyme
VPPAPLPPDAVELIQKPNHAVIGSLRPDGSPHTTPTWYDWDDGHVLLNMDENRRRLRYMEADPRVSLSVLADENWYLQVTLFGRIDRIEKDNELKGADRLALRYTGEPFGAREAKRVNAWMKVDSWFGWSGSEPWPSR